eukprot:TRINITY_DN29555_c0_g1_i1.p1 TRINITY_DN29555_c0_g1~~TRINITY_DN29555_c0_g1_i1.p1  ORF type:complete len:629 (-),score=32.96 TRINITY_DN29555_c0_g1_i1:480-2366(-)
MSVKRLVVAFALAAAEAIEDVSLTSKTYERLLEKAWNRAQHEDADIAVVAEAIPFLDPPVDGNPHSEGLVYQEANAIMGMSQNALAEHRAGAWLQWYPRLSTLKEGTTHVQMLGRNVSWDPTMWGFNTSEVQPPLPPSAEWPEAAKVTTGYAYGGPSPQAPNASDVAQRLFSTTPGFYRLAPFNGHFGTSVRLATNCLWNCNSEEQVSDVPRITDYAVTDVGHNNSDITVVHLLESRRYVGVIKIQHHEQTLNTSTMDVEATYIVKEPLEVCETCPQFSLGPALSSMFWRSSGASLSCACNGAFSIGDVVFSNIDIVGPNGERLPTGYEGFVIAGSSHEGGRILVEFGAWSGGTDGNCHHAECGECTPWGSSREWMACADIERGRWLDVVNGGAAHDASDIVFETHGSPLQHTPLNNPGSPEDVCTRFYDGPVRTFGLVQNKRKAEHFRQFSVGYEQRPSIIFEDIQAHWTSGRPVETRAMVWTSGTDSEYADNVAAGVILNEDIRPTTSMQRDAIRIRYRVRATIDDVFLGRATRSNKEVAFGPGSWQCGFPYDWIHLVLLVLALVALVVLLYVTWVTVRHCGSCVNPTSVFYRMPQTPKSSPTASAKDDVTEEAAPQAIEICISKS